MRPNQDSAGDRAVMSRLQAACPGRVAPDRQRSAKRPLSALPVIESILLGVLAGILVPAPAAESSTAKPAGVVAIAPGVEALGSGWVERRVVFAIDPLDQPPETVNAAASRDASNRSRLLAQVRAGMKQHGAVGTGYFGYSVDSLAHGQGRYDLYLSRYPNQERLEQRWRAYARQADDRPGPGVGDAAVWLPRKGSDDDYRLVFRKGLCLARLECTARQELELLIHLARVVANNVDKTAGPTDTPNSASPSR